jgi:hypothetical protein
MTIAPAAPAAAPSRRRLRLPVVHPFELVTLAMVLLTVVTLRACGMRVGRPQDFDYIVLPALRLLPRALLVGLAANLLYHALVPPPGARAAGASPTLPDRLRDYLQGLRRPGWWALWLRLLVAQVVMTYAYFWLKVTTPLLRGELLDGPLARLDQALHLGVSPSILVVQLVAGTPLAGWLDRWYALWVPTVFYTIAVFSTVLDDTLRRRFALSCVLLWTLGAWLYVALPAVGPCFVTPEVFVPVHDRMPEAVAAQAVLWENFSRMLEGRRTGELHSFNPTRGVACMPSLHVGAHFLFFLWARRRAPPLRLPYALATAFTLLAAVASGWHYAVDGYAAMLLAWLCFRASLWIERGQEGGDPAFPVRAAAA